MFFILSKVLYFLVQPIVWIIFFVAVSLLSKVDRRKRVFKRLAFFSLLFFTNPWIANQLDRLWSYHPQEVTTVKEIYPLGIVLGGFSNPSALPASFFHNNPSADRISTAHELFQAGLIEKILITSGSGRLMGDQTNEATYAKEYLMELGVPDSSIIVEDNSKNTYENARETHKLLSQLYPNGIPKSLLITSPFHMRRSLACFEKAGFTNSRAFSAGTLGNKGGLTLGEAINPSLEAAQTWERTMKEMVGYVVYKLKGYI